MLTSKTKTKHIAIHIIIDRWWINNKNKKQFHNTYTLIIVGQETRLEQKQEVLDESLLA